MVLIGRGNTAEVFEYGEGKVCKLFYEGYDEGAVQREYANAQMAQQVAIGVVKCYGRVEIENRQGILYEKIDGKSMLECLGEASNAEKMIETLVALHKEILAQHLAMGTDYKKFLLELINWKDPENKDLKEKVSSLPEGDFMCHGDFHPGNILIDEKGQARVIDFMNLCYGPWQYDVARTYFLLGESELPQDMAENKEIAESREQMARGYLAKMGVDYEEIVPYLEVIRACRRYE